MKKLLYLVLLIFIGCGYSTVNFHGEVIVTEITPISDNKINCKYKTNEHMGNTIFVGAFCAACGEFNIGDTVKLVKY